jgi:hypothetical protein
MRRPSFNAKQKAFAVHIRSMTLAVLSIISHANLKAAFYLDVG